MGSVIGVNFGNFLPQDVVEPLKKAFDKITSIIQNLPIDDIDVDMIIQYLSEFNITAKSISSGKDTLIILHLKIKDFEFAFKVFRWTLEELLVYLLSIHKFYQHFTDTINLDNGVLKIELLHIYAISTIQFQDRSVSCALQEYSDTISYIEYTKTNPVPENLIKVAWKTLHQNGFVIDYMPKNFLIRVSKNQKIYMLEYIDYLFFNDPILKQNASDLSEEISNGTFDHPLLHYW